MPSPPSAPAVRAVAPIVRARTQVIYGNRNWVPDLHLRHHSASTWTSASGTWRKARPSTDRDVRNGSKVCLLGQRLVRELFQGESPIGKEVRIQNVSFKVIGVLTAKGRQHDGHGPGRYPAGALDDHQVPGDRLEPGQRQPERADRPATLSAGQHASARSIPSAQSSLYPLQSATQAADTPLPVRFTNVDQILAAAQSDRGNPRRRSQQITQVLRERHRIRPGEPDDFNIRDMTEMTKTLSSTATMMTKLLLAVALISLVVGGVGIMNIMLVSVTERTREIGLRMAVGAQEPQHPAAVSGRIGGVVLLAEESPGSPSARRFPTWSRSLLQLADRIVPGRHRGRLCRFGHRRHRFRLLSGMESVAAGSHHRAALRIDADRQCLAATGIELCLLQSEQSERSPAPEGLRAPLAAHSGWRCWRAAPSARISNRPTPRAPAAWNAQQQTPGRAAQRHDARPGRAGRWWKNFNDPMLTSLVERAIPSNLDVRQAEARIRQARAARGVAAAALWPQVDLSASYSRSRRRFIEAAAGSRLRAPGAASGGDTNLFQVGLDASWELDIFGGVRRNVEAADGRHRGAIEDRRDVLVSLVAEVGTNYINLRGFQQQIAIANREPGRAAAYRRNHPQAVRSRLHRRPGRGQRQRAGGHHGIADTRAGILGPERHLQPERAARAASRRPWSRSLTPKSPFPPPHPRSRGAPFRSSAPPPRHPQGRSAAPRRHRPGRRGHRGPFPEVLSHRQHGDFEHGHHVDRQLEQPRPTPWDPR